VSFSGLLALLEHKYRTAHEGVDNTGWKQSEERRELFAKMLHVKCKILQVIIKIQIPFVNTR
jgi:hypothetical protein